MILSVKEREKRSESLNFRKLAVSSSYFKFDENTEFFVRQNDLNFKEAELKSFVKNISMPQSEVNKLPEDEKPAVFGDRFRGKVLSAILEFSGTLVGKRQLTEYLSMKDGKQISDSRINSALNFLLRLGFIESCRTHQKGSDGDRLTLFKISSLRSEETLTAFASKSNGDGEGLSAPQVEFLPAWKIQECNILSEIACFLFKANAVNFIRLPNTIKNEKSAKISAYTEFYSGFEGDKRVYIFAPRRQNNHEQYLKAALAEFIKEHENDEFLPKLMLCCEDAQHIYDTHELLKDYYNDVEIIYTDDLSIYSDFANSFSVFDENGAELSLSIIESKAQNKKPAQQQGRQNNRPKNQSKQNKTNKQKQAK